MIFKEIFLTPQIFSQNYLDEMKYFFLKSLLENIKVGGFVMSLNNKDWTKEVSENISLLANQKFKIGLARLLSTLKDCGRVEFQPKTKIVPDSEEKWISIANEISNKRTIDEIFSTNKDKRCLQKLEDIDISNEYGYKGSINCLKTEENFDRIFCNSISYAKKIKIIDPYFYIDENRYKKSLNLIAKNFGERRGNPNGGTIIINCRYNYKGQYKNEPKINANILRRWQNVMNEIFKKYQHIVKVYVWHEKENEEKIRMHERYLIGDKIGLSFGAGFDISSETSTEIGIKNYEQLDEISSPYEECNDVFDLRYIVTAGDIIENQPNR